tara:strand:+ start:93 stop:749 length:657 start_codon:yes stop_codon:yes gene_type:complete
MPLSKIQTGTIDANAIGPTELNLASNYTFTGTHTTPNGFVLLNSTTDTSNVNYNSDVDILDFTSYVSTYRKFFYTIDYMPISGGNYHLFQYFKNANTGNKIDGRVVCNGWLDNNQIVTPNTGTSNYLRTWFTAAGPGIVGHMSGYVFNGRRSDADYDCGAMGISNYHYSGQGNATIHYSFMASASAAEGIGKIGLNADQVGHSNDNIAKVVARVWGMT